MTLNPVGTVFFNKHVGLWFRVTGHGKDQWGRVAEQVAICDPPEKPAKVAKPKVVREPKPVKEVAVRTPKQPKAPKVRWKPAAINPSLPKVTWKEWAAVAGAVTVGTAAVTGGWIPALAMIATTAGVQSLFGRKKRKKRRR